MKDLVKIKIKDTNGELSHFGINDGDELIAHLPTKEVVSKAVAGEEDAMQAAGVDENYVAMCMCRDQVVLYKAYRPNGAPEWLVFRPEGYEILEAL